MLNSTLRYSLCCRFCQHLHQRSIHVYCFQYGIATKQQSKHVKISCKLWHGALNPFASRSDISKHFGNVYQIFKKKFPSVLYLNWVPFPPEVLGCTHQKIHGQGLFLKVIARIDGRKLDCHYLHHILMPLMGCREMRILWQLSFLSTEPRIEV